MKKKIILLLLTLTFCCFGTSKVNAETIKWEALEFYGKARHNVYRKYLKTDGTEFISKINIGYIHMENNPIFCIEMEKNISGNLGSGTAETTNLGTLSEYFKNNSNAKNTVTIGNRIINVLDAVGLISKYGSEYYKAATSTGEKNLYYLAAQQMIWQILADTGVSGGPINGEIEIFYYNNNDSKTIIDLSKHKKDIINKIIDYYISPNIKVENLSQPILSEDGTKYTITMSDSNEILDQFSLSTSKSNINCVVVDKATAQCSYPKDVVHFFLYLKKNAKSTIDKVFKVGNNYQATLLSDRLPNTSSFKLIGVNNPTYTIKIIKKDYKDTNKFLEGVTYDLCSDDECETIEDTQKTDKNGIVEFHGLEINKDYYLQESATLDNYILDSEIKKVNININDNNYDATNLVYTVTYTNTQKEEINGYIQIIKTDKENTYPLEGVTFDVYNINDNVIETIKTDKDGKAKTKLLPEGTYYVKEKETLKEYILSEEVQVITIDENDKVYNLNFTNEKSPQTGDTKILLVITIALCTLICAIIIYIKKISLIKNNTI